MPKVTEEHRASRRREIVLAARKCVMDQGFHKTTIADVIRESGLSAGAVYGYFRSKEEIVAAIADDALSTVDQLFEGILAGPSPVSPVAALQAVLEHVVGIGEMPDNDPTRVAIQTWAEALHNDAIMVTASSKYRILRLNFEAVARRAQADGTIDPDANPELIARTMLGLILGFVLQRVLLGDATPAGHTAGLSALLNPLTPRSD